MTVAAARPGKGMTGPRVLAILVGFFVTVLAADLVMVISALDSQPGLVADHPYERGLAHDALLAEEARQAGLHWQIAVDQQDRRLTVAVVDGQGAPLAADHVALRLVRPAEAGLDRTLDLRPVAAGRWQADLAAVPAGQWEVAVAVFRGTDRLDSLERLVIR